MCMAMRTVVKGLRNRRKGERGKGIGKGRQEVCENAQKCAKTHKREEMERQGDVFRRKREREMQFFYIFACEKFDKT